MAYTRRKTDKDATWQRAWTADGVVDLAAISLITGTDTPKHGDIAFVTANGFYYLWMDDGTWTQISGVTTPTQSSIVPPVLFQDEGDRFPSIIPPGVPGLIGNPNINARAYKTVNQSIPTGVTTTLTFDIELFNNGNVHSNVTNPSRFTVPAGTAGIWLLAGNVSMNGALGTHNYIFQILKNGAIIFNSELDVTITSALVMMGFVIDLAADGDFYEFAAFQNTGSSQNAIGGLVYTTWGSAIKLV